MAIYPCRIRKYRKAAHLSQRELASLIGLASQGVMSEIESGLKRPGLRIALACSAALDASLPDLFPRLSKQVEHDLLAHARELTADLERARNRHVARGTVAALISRLAGA
jgi:transcriptional regulator with XRE-family HTH domain